MESPLDKCEGFDNSLRRIKQLKHHISKLSQNHGAQPQAVFFTPCRVLTPGIKVKAPKAPH